MKQLKIKGCDRMYNDWWLINLLEQDVKACRECKNKDRLDYCETCRRR